MKKFLSILAITIALSACGGGDASDTTTGSGSNGTFKFELSKESVNVDEGAIVYVKISAEDSGSYTVSSSSNAISVTLENDQIRIDTGDVDRNINALVTVKGTQGKMSGTNVLPIAVTNTSAEPLLSAIDLLVSHGESISEFGQTTTLFNMFLDLSHLTGAYSSSEIETAKRDFRALIHRSKDEIASASELTSDLSAYHEGLISDTELESAYQEHLAFIKFSAQLLVSRINSVIQALGGSIGTIELTTLHYNEAIDKLSFYMGNQYLGQHNNGTWEFNTEYAYMHKILPDTFTPNICPIDA